MLRSDLAVELCARTAVLYKIYNENFRQIYRCFIVYTVNPQNKNCLIKFIFEHLWF